MYHELHGVKTSVPWKNLIRGNLASSRAIFILWMTCHCRLHTKDRISKFGISTDGACVFCGDTESCDHLFFECGVTNNCCQEILDWIEIDHLPREWKHEIMWLIGITKGSSTRARILKICVAEAIYHVWITRNKRVF